jgi:Protein of unknown function (DUF3040)
MSLAPGEQQTLTAIESQLQRSDPGLAAMFAAFSSQVVRRQGPVRELLSPWRPRSKRVLRIVLLAVLAGLLVLGIVLGFLVTSHAGPPDGTFVPVPGTAGFPHHVPYP